MEENMAMEFIHGKILRDIKVGIRMILNMELASTLRLRDKYLKVNGMKAKDRIMVF